MRREIFAGLGLGLLVGIIIGLSIAEVTGIILGALTSILAAFFGLRSSKEGETGNQIIIGTFSFSCVLSIFFGLFIRTNNLLTPSIESEVAEYKAASFDTAEIKKILLFKHLGIVPEGQVFSKEAIQISRNSVLMSGQAQSLYLCDAISEDSRLVEIKKAFDDSGKDYQEIEQQLTKAIPDSVRLQETLIFFKNLLCKEK